MHYSDEFVDKLEKRVSIPKEEYIKTAVKTFSGEFLDKEPLNYKKFGVYWWAVKSALRRHVNNGAWYCGANSDPVMWGRAWHGSEFRTLLAAGYYFAHQPFPCDAHIWTDKEGNEHEYALFDQDLGA